MHEVRNTRDKVAARLAVVADAVYRRQLPLPALRCAAAAPGQVAPGVDDSVWPAIEPGSYWGDHRASYTLRTSFTAPTDWQQPAALVLPLGTSKSLEALAFLYGPEGLVFLDGEAVQGVDPNHPEFLLSDRYLDGQPHQVAIDAWTGIKDERYEMGQPSLVEIDQPTRDFVTTAGVALAVLDQLPDESPVRLNLLDALDEAFLCIDLREPASAAFYDSIPTAHQTLRKHIETAGPPTEVVVTGVGHAHLDVAWLWPVSQTRKKAAQTFANVLRLMEQYPDFCYTQSQPQLYQYIAEDHPEMIEAIKERVEEGRWETIGGMWIEADCNISGAEALARQFLLGREFFLRTFGRRDSPVLWLPDVFGYAWQLPQLIKRAGLDYFVTAKMSWNQYNRLPYDQFWWKGLDGTEILTNFITTSKPGWWGATYSADLSAEEIVTTWQEKQHKELYKGFLVPFGHGDGGGGPTREMLDQSAQMRAHPGLPQVRLGTVADYMRELDETSGSRLPTWNGELYFELHRGTYTSQAANKRDNRKCEFRLHDAEFLAAWASLDGQHAYPHATLRRAWELLCLNQFHDILPGASIPQVYVDSERDHREIEELCATVRDDALAVLDHSLPVGTDVAIYNPTSFARSAVIEVVDDRLTQGHVLGQLDGSPLPSQRTDDGALVMVPSVPPYGSLALRVQPAAPADSSVGVAARTTADGCTLENPLIRATFDGDGDLVELLDKRDDRQLLAPGAKANQWQAFEDRPLDWEAWDLDIFYDDKQWLAEPAASIRILEEGPLRATLEIRRRVLESEIVQRISLCHDSARLDFATQVDWRERQVVLKVAFPVDILSPKATYDIQWGNVERPTHRNTSWDWARFETCAHKWADLSAGDFGLSILNDCKYGHDIRDDVMRLTVLRGATFPDPNADLGEHEFTYSLFPHTGDWRNGTVPEAYALNDPLIVRRPAESPSGSPVNASRSLVRANGDHVIIETIKRAENDDGLIVRLYENERTSTTVDIQAGFEVGGAQTCNLLEEDEAPLVSSGDHVALPMRPYQITTVRLTERSGEPA